MFFFKGAQVGGANLGSFLIFVYFLLQLQRLRPLGCCAPLKNYIYLDQPQFSLRQLLPEMISMCVAYVHLYRSYYYIQL